jgi:hypothetical protein
MKSGKRFGFSAVEKSKIWSCWKVGRSLHEIGAPLTSHTARFDACCCLAEAFLPRFVVVRSFRSTWQSGKIYREGLLSDCRFVRLLNDWTEQPPHWAGRFFATGAVRPIAPMRQITMPGTRPCDRRRASWLSAARYATSLRVNCCVDRLSRQSLPEKDIGSCTRLQQFSRLSKPAPIFI